MEIPAFTQTLAFTVFCGSLAIILLPSVFPKLMEINNVSHAQEFYALIGYPTNFTVPASIAYIAVTLLINELGLLTVFCGLLVLGWLVFLRCEQVKRAESRSAPKRIP